MEPTGAKKATSLTDARATLLSRIPHKAMCHEVVGLQLASFNDGLEHFHTGKYHEALALFHVADGMQESNLILFTLSLTYYLIADYGAARSYADRIDAIYFGADLIPELTDVNNLYFLIDAQAAGWEEQEDNLRRSDGPPRIYIPPDLIHLFKPGNIRQ